MKNNLQSPARLVCVDDTRFDAHHAPGPHPECPARLEAARAALSAALDPARLERLNPRLAEREELLRAHSLQHLEHLERALAQGSGQLDADTFFSAGSREAAWLAAGASAQLGERLAVDSGARAAVLTARPPGHHATRDRAMGFCLLNNVAVAAHAALAAGAARVAIVDWDVHHGNGTQDIFFEDPRVLFVSLHQWPLYPGTGHPSEIGQGAGRGTNVNLAMPAGAGGAAYGHAFRQVVLPALEAFAPQLVLVSAGYDAHRSDPLAGLALVASDYAAMTAALWAQACERGAPALGLFLEGGYDLGALQASFEASLGALLGRPRPLVSARLRPEEQLAVDETRRALRGYLGM